MKQASVTDREPATMPDPPPDASVGPELVRAVRADDLDRVAEILTGIENLYSIPSQADAVERLQSGEAGMPPAAGGLTRDGDFVPFYFTDQDRARAYAVEHGFLDDPEQTMLTLGGEPARLIRVCLERGFGGMVLNPGTDHPAPLARRTVAELARRMGVQWEGADEESGEGERGPTSNLTPPPHALNLAERVRKSPDLGTTTPPDVAAAECGRMLQELRELWAQDRIPPWELLDTLAYRMAFHVPVRPEPVQGLRWPLVARHPQDQEKPAVWIFTDPDRAREAMAGLSEEVETVRLSGLEALRWIWAAPSRIEEIIIDLYPGSPGPFSLPDVWALSVLYPHFLDYSNLDRVEPVPLDRLGELPGARGTKAECVRALVRQWKELVALRSADDGPVEPVSHGQRRFRPIFSAPDRCFDFDSARPEGSGTPVPMKDRDEAPFREWLLQSKDCGGVILDPGSAHPLPLDHTDLAFLALWTELGRRPDGADLAAAVASARDDLGPRICGRIVADWPRYYWALRPGEGEEGPQAMTLPDRDACPAFTSEEKIQRFLGRVREWEMVPEGMQPLMYLTGWAFNIFQEMRTRYREGGWIDPRAQDISWELGEAGEATAELLEAGEGDALDGEGLEVSPEMVRSALARIEWRLQPRVPDFLAE